MDFQGGSMQKNGKLQGGHGKFDWKSRGSTSKKLISLTGGGIELFFTKVFRRMCGQISQKELLNFCFFNEVLRYMKRFRRKKKLYIAYDEL